MTTTAELKQEQVDKLDLTISFTMTISQWKNIRIALLDSNDRNYNYLKVEFIKAIKDNIDGMTGRLEGEYPNNPPQK